MKGMKRMGRAASHHRGKVLIIVALAVLLFAGAWATTALLTTRTQSETNSFDAGAVACRVNSDYTITNVAGTRSNPGTITDAYIRAAVMVNWTKTENGQTYVYGTPPSATFSAGTGWTKSGDYYYYTTKVPAGESTTVLVKNLICGDTTPDGYTLTVQVVAEAIQADGVDENNQKAVKVAWGVDPTGLQ